MDLWDIHQDSRIREVSRDSASAHNKATRTSEDLLKLQRQVDHLTLMCQSMWELLRQHTGLTDDQLRAKVADVDTRDGKADGKISGQVFPCPACGANCNSSRQNCTMCGEDLKKHKPHIFEG
jgi:hypothetical protein